MNKFLFTSALIVMNNLAQASTSKLNMFFYCKGHQGELALQVSSKSYFPGQIRGFRFEIRGLYNNYNDEIFESQQPVIKQANYKPRNPILQGLDKYVVESPEYTKLALMLPTREELEKQWTGGGERNKSNRFKAYVQMQYRSGDSFVSIPMDCNLNWKPSR